MVSLYPVAFADSTTHPKPLILLPTVAPAAVLHNQSELLRTVHPSPIRPPTGFHPHFYAPPPTNQFATNPQSQSPSQNPSGPLIYHNGATMVYGSNNYDIFWYPPGYTYDSILPSAVIYYQMDVQSQNFVCNNVYGIDKQYYDTFLFPGQTTYPSCVHNYISSVQDVDSYPPGGCIQFQVASRCFTLAQLLDEVAVTLDITGWPVVGSNIYHLFLPSNITTCIDNTPNSPCAYVSHGTSGGFCAYHTWASVNGGEIYLDVEPYTAQVPGVCSVDQAPSNNQGQLSDLITQSQINSVSHEHNEIIEDQNGQGWYGAAGLEAETGDICNFQYYEGILSPNGQWATNEINGEWYRIQNEYSNAWGRCVATP